MTGTGCDGSSAMEHRWKQALQWWLRVVVLFNQLPNLLSPICLLIPAGRLQVLGTF